MDLPYNPFKLVILSRPIISHSKLSFYSTQLRCNVFLCWGHLQRPLTKSHTKLTVYRHHFGFLVVILDLFCSSLFVPSRGHREGAQWVKVGSTPAWDVSSSQGTLLEGKFRAPPPLSRTPSTVLLSSVPNRLNYHLAIIILYSCFAFWQ